MLDSVFADLIKAFPMSLEALLSMPPVTLKRLPPRSMMPKSGIYLWTANGQHTYVGRSRRMRERLQEHARESSGHNQASFAFRLAREATGCMAATYAKRGSRSDLLLKPEFSAAFSAAKARLRSMDLRFVEESDPVRQCLLEVYIAVTLRAQYNDFDSH